MKNLVLITGGAKSGKSDFAEKIAMSQHHPVVYLATMPLVDGDSELTEKIKRHKERRPPSWQTLEVPENLIEAVTNLNEARSACIIECLSLYINNIVYSHFSYTNDAKAVSLIAMEKARTLLALMEKHKNITFLVVTSEVGFGIVPENALARAYLDILGEVNKEFARKAHQVWLSCVGLQIKLKS